MLEILVLLGLASPFLLMVWLTMARRKAQEATRDHYVDEPPAFSEHGFTETTEGEDGLAYGRKYDGDGAVIPPDVSDGESDGIRALQGRR